MTQNKKIGFACAYTPLALIDAAGFTPYRIFPMTHAPDQAGHLLHDNMCPHIKRILDRALYNDLPDLHGMIFMNSCEAMRRLADTWKRIRPQDPVILLDLPVVNNERAVSFFSSQLSHLVKKLSEWSGQVISTENIKKSMDRYSEVISHFDILKKRVCAGTLQGGSVKMQSLYNQVVTEPLDQTLESLQQLVREPEVATASDHKVPIYIFGNILPDPEAFSLFESSGARLVADNLCTGSRTLSPVVVKDSDDLLLSLARSLLSRPACARTFEPKSPGKMAQDILAEAKACKARGVIGHTVKFCDPYLARLPAVRDVLKKEGFPFLLLEGDCTLRSMGQHRTRIEAFIEMLR